MRWTDNHCHLEADTAADTVAEARAAGVERLITVGTDVASSETCIALARAHDGVYATAGVHPHDAQGGLHGLAELLTAAEVVAVGECGLDYHYDHSPCDVQRSAFAAQIELALRHDLPLVVHTRDAWDDTFAILGEVGVPERTVFHCFTGGPTEAERALATGAVLSFSGIVTFRTADNVRAAARRCPLDRLMVETDAPFLTPVPHRGQPNRPALVPLVGAAVARAKAMPLEAIATAAWSTASGWYRLEGHREE